ncbi:MAG TPA: PA14 domain-containing protein [Tepidisphaeraceae bacterium]|nr:PA14 domain-containing protein [Tepidisphaeraceae bacterium]
MSHTRGGTVGEGQNSVRKSSKRSRIILGAAVASALAGMTASSVSAVDYSWTGTAGGPSFWDVATNWSPNTAFPTAADNAAFGGGALDFNVNLNGIGQNVNNVTLTNAAGSYVFSNGTLSVSGALTQSGAATNIISAQIGAVSGWTVSAGTLRVTNTNTTIANNFNGQTIAVGSGATLVAGGGSTAQTLSSAIANSNIALSGGILRASGTLSQNALLARYYDTAVGQATLDPIGSGGGLLTMTPNGSGVLTTELRTSDVGQTGSDIRVVSNGIITDDDNFSVLWSGNLTVSAANAGQWVFGTRSDDGSVIYIDKNNNGIFEKTADPGTNELIVDNNFFQGPTSRAGGTLLAAGTYKVAIGWYEGGVTGEVTAGFITPVMLAAGHDPLIDAHYANINPNSLGSPNVDPTLDRPSQNGMWSLDAPIKYAAEYANTTVGVAAGSNSTVDVDATSASFGALTLGAGSTLNVTGSGGASFAGTTASGTVTINASQNVSTGVIGNGGGVITRLNKLGSAQVSAADLTGASGFTSASTISVQAGKFLSNSDGTTNTIRSAGGAALISLDGGTFVAQSSSAGIGLRETFVQGNGFAEDPNQAVSDTFSLNLRRANFPAVNTDPGPRDGWENNSTYIYSGKIFVSDNGTIGDGLGQISFAENFDDNVLIRVDGVTKLRNTAWDIPTGTGTLTLPTGWHDVDLRVGQGGGGVGASGTAAWPVDFGLVFDPQGRGTINPADYILPVDSGDGSLFRDSGTIIANFSDSNVVVTQNSGIDVFAPMAIFGNLTVNSGMTLTITGLGAAVFNQTTASGGDLLVNTDGFLSEMRPGRILNGGGLTGITKTGNGTLTLDNTAAPSVLTGAMHINATGGTLAGTTDGVNNPFGAAPISLTNTNLVLSSKVGGPVSYANPVSASGTFRVSAANKGTGAVDAGAVTLNTLNAAADSNISVAANNSYSLTLANVNLAGNASINNSSSDTAISFGNITGVASSVVNINGANRSRITGNVAGNNVIINSPGVDFDPGAATTKTVAANTQVNTEMRIATGVIDYGQNVITGNPAHFTAGLYESRLGNPGPGESDRNINKSGPNINERITLGLNHINQGNVDTTAGENAGWITDSTYVYTGQIFIPDNDVAGDGLGKVSFGENFDDYVQVKVDGALKIDDPAWNVPSSSGPLVLAAGWHDVEFRGGQGVGGVGPVGATGWGGTKALGIDLLGRGTTNGDDYVVPVDNGTMNLFRALVPIGGVVDIESGTELKVGGLTTLAAVNLNGATGLSKLTLNNHAIASSSDVVNINLVGSGSFGEVNIGTNTTLTATNLVIDGSGASLTKSGPGVLRVSGTTNLQSGISITAGKLQMNGVGSGPGGATVESGGTLGGTGSFAGPVLVNTGGSLSPHDGTGVATLTLNDALTLNPAARLDFNFGLTSDSVTVLSNLTLNGNTTLNLNAITGFTTGTFRLLTMTNFTDTGDVVLGTNTGPAAFNYSIVETPPAGIDPGHIDLVVTAQILKWTGATNNNWDINTTINWQNSVPSPAKYIDLTAVVLDNGAATNRSLTVVPAGGVQPASITVDNDATHPYSIGGNAIAGNTGITKRGVGTLTLTGASNSYIGPVIVEAGILDTNALANAGSNSPLGAGPSPITLGSASTAGTIRYSGGGAGSTDRGLTFAAGGGTVDNAQNATFGGIVSGDGNLTKTGAGTLFLSGLTNTNSGSIAVNDGTVSVASMGAGGAGSLITLASGKTFEYTGANHTGARGVTTPSAGATGTIGVTNAATKLDLSGAVSGQTISKAGPGNLTLSGLVNFTGTTHSLAANSGILAYTGTGGNTINGTYGVDSGSTLRGAPGSLGSVAVALNGGTLSLQGAAGQQGLVGEFYQFGPSQAILNTLDDLDAALVANAGSLYATANTSLADLDPRVDLHGAINHIAGPGNPFDQYGGLAAPGGFDNLVTRWTGKINISAAQAGLTQFFTASDDGSVLWVDGVKVVDNNFFQGTTERGGSISLSEGAHDIVIGFYEGGGDASAVWKWIPVGGGKDVVPNNVLSSGTADWVNNVSTAVGTTSTIDVTAAAMANVGALNLGNNSTLRVTSGSVHFTGTTLATAAGTYNINSGWDTNLNQVSGSGTINHAGGGKMILETSNLAGLGAGSVINMTGGTLGAVGDAGMTNPLGAASVNLSNTAGILLGARAGDVTFNTPVSGSGTVRVGSGIVGSSTVGPHTLTLGSAANPLNLAAGSTANLSADNGTSLVLPAVQLAGDGTLNNSSTSDNVTIGNINITGSTATFGGSRAVRLTGNITGAVTNVVVRNGALNVDPGAAATSNINGPMKVVSILNAQTGTTNLGNNVISGQTAVAQAGLVEQFANGGFYEGALVGRPNTFGVPDSIQLYPRRANQARGDTNGDPPGVGGNADVPGWTDNSTYIYTGQILVPDNGTVLDGMGSIAFGASFDDSVLLKIDGQQRMRDTNWHNATSTGEMVLTAGWHDIEMRFGEGTGGVGPDNDAGLTLWGATFPDGSGFASIGIQTDPSIGFDPDSSTSQADGNNGATIDHYHNPVDDGSMNLFRIATSAESGTINVAAGATVNAGGLVDIQLVTLNGGASPAVMNLSNTSSHTGTVTTIRANGAAGSANTINLGANNTLNAQQLVVATGTIFNKNGLGTLRITSIPGVSSAFPNAHEFADESEVHVNAGKLVINSIGTAGTGSVFVASAATLGGNGSITGAVSVDPGGHIAPGDSVGTLTVGGLALNASAFDVEGSAAGLDKIMVASDGTGDVFTLSGNSSVNLFDLGGVAAGDYVIVDYNNQNAIASLTGLLTISNPGAFAGLTASLINDTANKDIVLHLEGGGDTAQWNVDSSGSWGVAANWLPAIVPDGSTFTANLLGKITAARTITLDGNRTVRSLNFDNANKYTVASGTGGTLTLAGGGGITVEASGSHEISAPVTLTGVNSLTIRGGLTMSGGVSISAGGAATKTGSGALTISGAQGHGAGAALTVNQGTVNLNSNAGTAGSAAGSNLSLNIVGGAGAATVALGSNQDLAGLNVATADPNSQTLDLASPAVAGQFHSVRVYAANLVTAKAALYNAIVNANQAGALDPLDGIRDSGLHASSGIGLAVLSGSDNVFIRPTKTGDLNLDGNVTISDFIDLASNFGTVGTATWQEGDLNYDRNVTISDFIDLASNFGSSYAGAAAPVSSSDLQTLASFASSIGVDPSVIGSAVPEPTTLSLLAIGAMGLMSRRRRKA